MRREQWRATINCVACVPAMVVYLAGVVGLRTLSGISRLINQFGERP